MATSAPTRMLLAAASFLLLAVALVEGAQEIGSYLDSGSSPQSRFHTILSGDYRAGPSSRSKDRFLRDCQDIGGGLYAAVQTDENRRRFFTACRDAARLMLQEMPAYSRAWLVEAETSAALDDDDQMRIGLRQSAATAPGAQWLVERRLNLAAEVFASLGDSERAVFDADVRSALEGPRSRTSLAQLYLDRSDLRESIAAAASTAPPAVQRQFLNEVRDHGR